MQEKDLNLRITKIGCLPIIDLTLEKMSLKSKLTQALSNEAYADAVLILLKNILINREAIYAVKDWARIHGLRLSEGAEINDDRIGRALERLFQADRATLQTEIVLGTVKKFNLKMDQIHSDTTSIAVSGQYADQDKLGVELKRGHSKDHRPDLKQLVYNLCVSRDGAIPIHFKCYDGNRSDDSIQFETWNSLRVLLQRPDFIYVADSKLCVEETMRKIDSEHGLFVTIVPRTRKESDDFATSLEQGEVRWEKCLRRKSSRHKSEFDTFEVATGFYQLREGFKVYWYRSSQKQKRDSESRKDRIVRAREKLESLDLRRLRGPKTETAMRKRVDTILQRFKVQAWLGVEIKMDIDEEFKALSRGKPTGETRYKKIIKKTPRLHIKRNAETIAKSQLMDGIFPLATNTKMTALEVLNSYKYQPHLEKRHAFLKSTLHVAPVWLKKNVRIEALMFVEYLAQMVASLIERELRVVMKKKNVPVLLSLPEGRASKTPTFEQLTRLFENRDRNELFEKDLLVKLFTQPLTPVQSQILELLKIEESVYA
jgi:transposase